MQPWNDAYAVFCGVCKEDLSNPEEPDALNIQGTARQVLTIVPSFSSILLSRYVLSFSIRYVSCSVCDSLTSLSSSPPCPLLSPCVITHSPSSGTLQHTLDFLSLFLPGRQIRELVHYSLLLLPLSLHLLFFSLSYLVTTWYHLWGMSVQPHRFRLFASFGILQLSIILLPACSVPAHTAETIHSQTSYSHLNLHMYL